MIKCKHYPFILTKNITYLGWSMYYNIHTKKPIVYDMYVEDKYTALHIHLVYNSKGFYMSYYTNDWPYCTRPALKEAIDRVVAMGFDITPQDCRNSEENE